MHWHGVETLGGGMDVRCETGDPTPYQYQYQVDGLMGVHLVVGALPFSLSSGQGRERLKGWRGGGNGRGRRF